MATLFSKSKGGAAEKEILMKLLRFVVKETQGVYGFANAPKNLVDKIEKLEPGLIQPRSGAEVDPAGNIAVFATSKGITAALGEGAITTEATAPATESKFVLETGFTPPVTKRGGVKASLYPFAQMKIGQSFFIPATAERPNPAKALASTASSASKRFKDSGRKFIARPRKAGVDGEKQDGARIFCVAAPVEAAASTQAAA